ncbi:transcription initiation factor TFIID subunit 4-like [Artibeus jamaicensis]|uniref:transcription initiation factor TFIID subunit 4-like n=1 Tax=Artibeus jamaicensis TaxID=9417 RepID=UPI00235A49F3|nr:transcription initiation factor TFIID subunit 4-like [Artibeus jamaicensis]
MAAASRASFWPPLLAQKEQPKAVPAAATSGSGRVARLRSPAPRRAPYRPRARSSRPAHSLAGSRRALPRPPAAGGGGGARPASRARRAHPGVRAWGSRPPPPQAARGGAVGPPALRGGARRATIGARLPAVPTLTTEHCGDASENGHELCHQGSASTRPEPRRPPPGFCSSPLTGLRSTLNSRSPRPAQPRPTPVPARTAPLPAACTSWSWLVPQSVARTRFFRAALPRQPQAAPVPASLIARAPSAPPARAYLQRGTATDTRRGLPALAAAGRGRDGRGARGHERSERREKEGEKLQCERETLISCLLNTPRLGTEPATHACTVTGNLTRIQRYTSTKMEA